jgi:hypothetical protein
MPHRRVVRLAARIIAPGLLSLAPAVPLAQNALWCTPAVGRMALRVAEACGHPVPFLAPGRVERMEEAFFGALERVHGAAARAEFRQGWEAVTRPRIVERLGCDAALRQWTPLIEALGALPGLETTERVEAEAAVNRDPRLGLCQ